MSLQPKIIVTEEVNTQVQALQIKRAELILSRDAIAERLNTIENIIKENELLENHTKEQVTESVSLYLEEWEKMKEYYPEIRLGILQKALEFIAPAEKKK